MMESFFNRLKVELVYAEVFKTAEQSYRALFEYIEVFYNLADDTLHWATNRQLKTNRMITHRVHNQVSTIRGEDQDLVILFFAEYCRNSYEPLVINMMRTSTFDVIKFSNPISPFSRIH